MYLILCRFRSKADLLDGSWDLVWSCQALDGDFTGLAWAYENTPMLARIRSGKSVVLARGVEVLDLVDELNRLARVVRTPEEVNLVQRARNLALNCFGDAMEIRFDLS
jgi:hypothetical protein